MARKNVRVCLFGTIQDRERIKVCAYPRHLRDYLFVFQSLSITSTRVVLDLRLRDLPMRIASDSLVSRHPTRDLISIRILD